MKKMIFSGLVLALTLSLSPAQADSTKPSPDVRFSLGNSGEISLCTTDAAVTSNLQTPSGLLPASSGFFSGYCTEDCSSCSSSAQCQSRGAGTCTQVPAC